MSKAPPIACTLTRGEFKDRLTWIAALARSALRRHERRDLVLDLRYAPEAGGHVREMVRNETACCSFLTFDLREEPGAIRLIITAPEEARDAADMLFAHFVAAVPKKARECPTLSQSGAGQANAPPPATSGRRGSKAAGLTAVTVATGAVACGACCVLPLALPAVVLAGTGSLLAWFTDARIWVTGLAVFAVLVAWGWIAWGSVRSRRKPALSTLTLTAAASVLLIVAILWRNIEQQLLSALMV